MTDSPSSPTTPSPPPSVPASVVERQLCEAMEALAGGVDPVPRTYRAVRGDWLRRERRRRMVLAALVIALFTVVTLIGLWVLNQAPAKDGVIFDDTVPTVHSGTR